MPPKINLHFPPQASKRSHGLQINNDGVIKLFDLSTTKTTDEDTPPKFSPYQNKKCGELLALQDNFRPRVIFTSADEVAAVGDQEIGFADLLRPDICRPYRYTPGDQRATYTAGSTGNQTVRLTFLTTAGLRSARVDPRESPRSAPTQTILIYEAKPPAKSVFNFVHPNEWDEEQKGTHAIHKMIVTDGKDLWHFNYVKKYLNKRATVQLDKGGRAVVDLKSSLNGWFVIVTFEKTIQLLDFTAHTSQLDQPRNFETFKSAREGPWLIPIDNHFPTKAIMTSSSNANFNLLTKKIRINIRAWRARLVSDQNISREITFIKPPNNSQWSSLGEIECWKEGFWYPAAGSMDRGPAFFRTQAPSVSNTVDAPSAGYPDDQPNDRLSYSSLKEKYHEEKPLVITIHDAKQVLQNRHGYDNTGYGPLLYFFATRMNDLLPPELRSTQISFGSRGEVLKYCSKWETFFGTNVPSFEESYETKRRDNSFFLSQSQSVVFSEPELGCLAISLKFLPHDIDETKSPFTKLTSILFAKSIESPLVLPIFHAFSENPELYLSDNSDLSGNLVPPGEGYKSPFQGGKIKFRESQAPEKLFPAGLLDKYKRVLVPIISPTDLQQTCADETDFTNFPEKMEMFVPKQACGEMWWDEAGNIKKPVSKLSKIQYPVCVPSRKVDACWQVDKWGIVDCKTTCLVLFVRPTEFENMSKRLANAVFVIVPLEDDGDAHAFTREQIRQWATTLNIPFIFSLDDNISNIWTLNKDPKCMLREEEWVHVFRALSTHAEQSSRSCSVAVWGLKRWGKYTLRWPKHPWVKRHCQCFMLLNIGLIKEKKIRYERKTEEHRKKLGDKFDELGPVEDYLLNYACEEMGCLVLQNRYYIFKKADRRKRANSSSGSDSEDAG